MGRTLPTFNLALERMQSEWSEFRRALRREDQTTFDHLFVLAKRHMAEASTALRPVPLDSFLVCVLLEQQKEIVAHDQELVKAVEVAMSSLAGMSKPERTKIALPDAVALVADAGG